MKFIIIDPKAQQVRTLVANDLHDAKLSVNLPTNRVDHGTIRPGLAIVIYDHCLFDPAETTPYFALNRKLYGGCAIVYAYDQGGDTIDIDERAVPRPIWLADADAVEKAIMRGLVERPQMAVNGEVFWQWPLPMPDLAEFARRSAEAMGKNGGAVIDGDTFITVIKK